MVKAAGIAASGHEQTSAAARELLEAGGNAFDAALGALCATCVCEPMLASLGGGGFLLAQAVGEDPLIYDFFTQTPGQKKPADEIDFHPIIADFGTATQEFHIGMGSMAVPGVVAGIFTVHRERCRLAIADIIAPAVRLAREGVLFNEFQNYISHILLPILQSSPAALDLVTVPEAPDQIAPQGSLLRNPDLADTLEALAREGGELFYQGELARRLASDCADRGGMLTLKDLSAYRVEIRKAVRFSSHGAEFMLNSPPSPSGTLVAFALAMLEQVELKDRAWGSRRHCLSIANAMCTASQLRKQSGMGRHPDPVAMETVLLPENLRQWRESAMPAALCTRGTTHLSVADAEGNLASLSVSNGEGCAYVLPGTGIMMNNMLGEEDLSPDGFHQWPVNRRMASMMCPAIARAPDGGSVALGSGGSNRIRSAIMQVLVNLFELGMPLERAVTAPRMHLEGDHLSMEDGFPDESVSALTEIWPDHRIWPEPNLFFGGVHAVERSADGRFRGAGDPRRGGSVALARHSDG